MNYTTAITYNQKLLARIVAEIFALIGLVSGGTLDYLPNEILIKAKRLLRPTESAVRRLIFLTMQGLVVKPSIPLARPLFKRIERKSSTEKRRMAFQLIDPAKYFEGMPAVENPKAFPNLNTVKTWSALPQYPLRAFLPDNHIIRIGIIEKVKQKPNIPQFCRRLEAVNYALNNLQKQAIRLFRLLAKRKRSAPMRPGRAPGYSPNHKTEINEILYVLHHEAKHVWNTS